MWDYDFLAKVIVVGDSGCGKSALLVRYTDDNFIDEHMATIGVDFKLKTLDFYDKHVKLQIWDTAGQERFRTITQSYYRGAHGIMLVYDITDMESFKHLQEWFEDIRRFTNKTNIPVVLVGNKIDLSHRRTVSTEAGQMWASAHAIPFIETSARDARNVDSAFHAIIEQMLEQRKLLSRNETITGDVRPDLSSSKAVVPSVTHRLASCCGIM